MYASWFILQIATDGTINDSWPFRSVVPLIGFISIVDKHVNTVDFYEVTHAVGMQIANLECKFHASLNII